MAYVFWAHLVIWILVSFYLFAVQRKLTLTESRITSVEQKLKEKREGEAQDG
jgi:CcmD family protein